MSVKKYIFMSLVLLSFIFFLGKNGSRKVLWMGRWPDRPLSHPKHASALTGLLLIPICRAGLFENHNSRQSRDAVLQTVENVSGESEDIDSKIEEYKNIIRRAETGLVKAEARLNALRAGQGEYSAYKLAVGFRRSQFSPHLTVCCCWKY